MLLRSVGYVVALCVLAFVVVVLMGSLLPASHTATVTTEIPASQQRVWQLITEVDAQPKWRTGLQAVEPAPEENKHPCWTEVLKSTRMLLCADVSAEPSTRIVRIADGALPFGGTWVYQLQPTGPQSTRVTITENGTVGPALWRFLDHYVYHEDANIKQYQADLLKATKS